MCISGRSRVVLMERGALARRVQLARTQARRPCCPGLVVSKKVNLFPNIARILILPPCCGSSQYVRGVSGCIAIGAPYRVLSQ